MIPETNKTEPYLESNAIIDWKGTEVQKVSDQLTSELTDKIEIARRLYEWVRDDIDHSNDIGTDIVTCTASEVLTAKTGMCYAKSHLLAGLLRAQNIPTGFCYQILKSSSPETETVVHALNAIYCFKLKKWILIDARGNTDLIKTEFSLDHESLAYVVDVTQGEYTHETIYTHPPECIVHVLQSFESRKEMIPNLPQQLR